MKDVVGWRIDDVVDQIRGNEGHPGAPGRAAGRSRLDGKPTRWSPSRATRCKLEEQAAKAQSITVPGADGDAPRNASA